MNVTIIAVGKLKEQYLREGVNEYIKRLGRYCKIQVIEVPDEKAPENSSPEEIEIIKKKEGEHVKRYFKGGVYKIALCIEGTMMSSEGFSDTISSLGVRGVSSIMFIIGGSLGLSGEVIAECDTLLSFSKMTFPHQLMRLILLEQVYRSFKIANNETYHK